jgi:hypothetical protein
MRAVDLAHPARPEQGDDLVRAQSGSGRKRHGSAGILRKFRAGGQPARFSSKCAPATGISQGIGPSAAAIVIVLVAATALMLGIGAAAAAFGSVIARTLLVST